MIPSKSKKNPNPQPILQKITGLAHPGELIAIMGSSGSGKTTFLNMLAKRNLKDIELSGKVLVDGYDYGSDITKISAYIQQENVFYREFTVREHLKFQANLRNIENADDRVETVIKEMGLEDCANTKIGDHKKKTLSGGEKKRLSFATQILRKPPILFCDEPTSGLDSYLANQVVQSLKKIAESGTIVFTTIHQPPSSTFAMFDKLILLAKGQLAYTGSSEGAIDFFQNNLDQACPKNYNPADHYLNVLSIDPKNTEGSKEKLTKYCDIYANSTQHKNIENEVGKLTLNISNIEKPDYVQEFKRANLCKQLIWLFWRSMIINYRDPMVCTVKVLSNTFMALIFGGMYLKLDAGNYLGAIEQCDPVNGTALVGEPALRTTSDIMNINGGLFMLLSLSTFPMVAFVTAVFPVMLPAWREEYYGGLYSMTIAFIAENLMELPLLLLLQLFLGGICYVLFGLVPTLWNFFMFYVIMELVAQASVSFGYMLSTCSDNLTVISALTPATICPMMIFGGFFMQSGSLPIYLIPIQYLSFFYYGNGALMHNQWGEQKLDCLLCNGTTLEFDDCPPNMQAEGDHLLAGLGFDDMSLNDNLIGLGALIVGYRFIAWVILMIQFRESNR